MESAENIEQQITLLSRELELAKVRFGRWLVVCCVFAVAASAIAVGTKSISFFVIAGLGWFFAWNRWKSRAFVSALSSKPVPSERYLKAGSLVLLIALCIARPLSAADPQEQTWFTAENPTVDRPVDLPKNVQASLMKDTVVLNLLGSQNKPAGEFPAEWFTASEIHLSRPDHVDLVVMGTGLLMGANINPFWVFRHTSSGFRLVLKGGAHDLEVRKARSNGYRNIRLYAMTAKDVFTLDYRFDGHRYRIYRKNSKPIA